MGWETFLANPFFGIGPGMSEVQNVYSVPHQSIIHVMSETGLLGGIAFTILIVLVVWSTLTSAVRASVSPDQGVVFLWLIGPSCWFFDGLLGGTTFNMSLALLWVGITHAMLALSSSTVLGLSPVPQRH